MGFAERLKQLREAKGYSQEDLAHKLGIPRSSLSHYERTDLPEDEERTPRRDRLKKLADFFEVPIDYLLGHTDIPLHPEKKDEQVNRAFLKLPDNVTEEEKEFLQKQLDLQLEIFRSLKKKEK